jgi:hypothetical protein
MVSFGMTRSVALVTTDVSEERIASIIRVTRIGELGASMQLLAKVCVRSKLWLLVTANVVPNQQIFHLENGGYIFLRNVGSYKNNTA